MGTEGHYDEYPDGHYGNDHYGNDHYGNGHADPHMGPTARPTMSNGGNGCNAAAMKQWKMAMAHWQEQQKDWEHHFEMWKHQNDGYDMPSGYDEYPSGSGMPYDWMNEQAHGGDHTGSDGDIWSMLMPVLEFFNSDDFCEMFNLLPADWEPSAWVTQCNENQRTQRMVQEIIEQLLMGQLTKYEYAEKICYTTGKSMMDAFTMAGMDDWAMHVGWAEEGCNCAHANVYDMVMGNDVDWMSLYNCGSTWYDLIMKMMAPYEEINQNFTAIPEGAMQILKLWIKDQKDVEYFFEDPRNAVMAWAAKWGISGNDIVMGLENWELLLEQYDAKLDAFGYQSESIYNMTYMDLYELFEEDQGKIDMLFADPSEKKGDLNENELWIIQQWGVEDIFMSEQAMDPWGETDGVNNFVLSARAYVDAMNAARDQDPENRRFVPADHFYAMLMHAGHLREVFEMHQNEHPNETFVNYVFENYMDIWAMIESWESGYNDAMEDVLEYSGMKK